ncbi:MAG: twin transmembrane helix small protein [Pseudomonadota bacterium]|nr:twin transmembrane helix small protein [Pseudomonadota bacterium]
MSGFLIPLMIFAMLATLGVLFFGIFTMARGSDFNRKHSNRIMRARIVLQGLALLLFALIMVIAGRF